MDQSIISYRYRKMAIKIVTAIMIAIVLSLFVSYMIYDINHWILLGLVLAFSAFNYAIIYSIWNCPNCGQSLGLNLASKLCKSCGVIFDEVKIDENDTEDLYSAYKNSQSKINFQNSGKIESLLKTNLKITTKDRSIIDEKYDTFIDDKYAPPNVDEGGKSMTKQLRITQLLILLLLMVLTYLFWENEKRWIAFGLFGIISLIEYIQSKYSKTIYFPRVADEKNSKTEFYAYQYINVIAFIVCEIIFFIKFW